MFYCISNLKDWDNIITTLMFYSVGGYFVYGYVFKKEIQSVGLVITIDDKYAGFKGSESLISEYNRSRSQCLRLPYKLY